MRLLLLFISAGTLVSIFNYTRESKQQQKTNLFTRIKPQFKYFNARSFDNIALGNVLATIHPEKSLKLKKIDLLSAKKLFAESKLFSKDSQPKCHSFSTKQKYCQLVFAGRGNGFYPDLVLMHYSPEGKLLAEITIACAFFDAGSGQLTKSVIKKDSLLVMGNLDLDESPEGVPCDSTAVFYRIEKSGILRKLGQKTYKINCNFNFD